MELKRKNLCPIFKKECIGLDCAWFVKVEGYDMNTGKRVDEWNCTVALIPMLLIENSGQQRSTGAAVESFRNEVVKVNQQNQQLYIDSLKYGITPAQITPLNQPINVLEEGK